MSKIAELPINSFASSEMQADSVSPSEEAVSDIEHIVQKATRSLLERIYLLEAKLTALAEDNASLRTKMTHLETLQESEISRVCVDIATDRRRISQLEQRRAAPPAPVRGEKSIARVAKIDEVLKSRGPTTLKQLEHILKISPKEMNRLLSKLDMRHYELHSRPGDDREKVLRLKAQIR